MILEMLGHKIADYKKRKRRNCFRKIYYKKCWVTSNELAQFKIESEGK